ncbi:MAG: sigma-70 family RNA polymerase sigma factor [Sedimentisphaerales bacterium]|nr:sigma-70 family RNA polymerase sigma factor [Sedimentisphaerales bacterium]
MKFCKQAKILEQARAKYTGFLASVLWKLTGDRELFTEAMQYALLGMWQHVGKLNGKKAGSYIYRIALSANSKAWRNRIGKNGELPRNHASPENSPDEKLDRDELATIVRREICRLPAKQAKAVVMRYFEQQEYQAIAGKLSCTEAGARSHVSKALATLKSRLATSP